MSESAYALLLPDGEGRGRFGSRPSQKKAPYSVWEGLFLAVVILVGGIASGLVMVGYPFFNPPSDTSSGVMDLMSFFGLLVLIFLCPLGFMLWARFIPDVLLLDRSEIRPADMDLRVGRRRTISLIVLGVMAVLAAVGAGLAMGLMIDPAGTYVYSQAFGIYIGNTDLQVVVIGGFLFVAFSFVALQSAAVLVWHLFPRTFMSWRFSPSVSFAIHLALFCCLYTLLLAWVSSLSPSPTGGGAVTPGNYFALPSQYSLVNHLLGSKFVYKLYEDVVIYYSCIMGIVLLAAVANRFDSARRLLYRRVWSPTAIPEYLLRWHPFPTGISVGEIILIAIFCGFFSFWAVYWRVIFPYIKEQVSGQELSARVVGHLINFTSSLVLLPASRTCLWVTVFAIPYERALAYHRFLGGLTFSLLSLHMFLWWGKWGAAGNLSQNIIAFNSLYVSSSNEITSDWTIPAAELIWLLLLASIVSAVLLRRRFYALFQYTHKYIGIVYYVVAICHAWSFWYYAIGGLALWLCDKLISSVTASVVYVPDSMVWSKETGITTITITQPLNLLIEPGQYFFVNIPEISLYQWHPFTASASLGGDIVFHIKNMHPSLGNGAHQEKPSWTASLAHLAEDVKFQDISMPSVRLHGPFGYAPFLEYDVLLLFAGGIGITPMMNVLTQLYLALRSGQQIRAAQITLVWMAPSVAMLALFNDIYAAISDRQSRGEVQPIFVVRLYCTRSTAAPSEDQLVLGNGVEFATGRCSIAEVFSQFSRSKATLAAVCGPTPLVRDVSVNAKLFQCDFHTEEFAF